jgi:hypothetical protein
MNLVSSLLTIERYNFHGFLYSTDDAYVTGTQERISKRYLDLTESLSGIRQARIPNQISKQFIPCT